MKRHILYSKSHVNGKIRVPPSKSYAQRAIAIASLIDSPIVIEDHGESNDVQAAISCVENMGGKITPVNKSAVNVQRINLNSDTNVVLNCGESGLATRLFSSFSLLTDQPFKVNGSGSVLNRPMNMVRDGLTQFGKKVTSSNNTLPLLINGKTINSVQEIEIDGSETSQFLTGLLIVCPFLPSLTVINGFNLKSKPYVDMTISILSHFGLDIQYSSKGQFLIEGNQQPNKESNYKVEGDWSSAVFFIVAGAIGGEVRIEGLDKNSIQADKSIIDAIKKSGALVMWEGDDLIVQKGNLKAFDFDAENCPDLFPCLIVLASFSSGTSSIKGVHRLKHKESNRAQAMIEECKKIGVEITNKKDTLFVRGNSTFSVNSTVCFSAHNDHRIAMALSLYSICSTVNIEIEGYESVKKSYPKFFNDFEQC